MNKQLIEQFKAHGLTYLDGQGYNEVEYHDNQEIADLYDAMVTEYLKPLDDGTNELEFNYFSYEDGIMSAVFSNPQVSIELADKESMQAEINKLIFM